MKYAKGKEKKKTFVVDRVYRFDPSRFILEHYVDGDLVNDQNPTNRSPASKDNLHVWGTFLSFDLDIFSHLLYQYNNQLIRTRFTSDVLGVI